MSAQASQAEAHDDPGPRSPGPHGPSPHDADTQGYRQVLHDLIAMGTDLARLLYDQATAPAAQATPHPAQQAQQAMQQPAPPSGALISLTFAFDRTARAVRRSILLARSLAHPLQPAPSPAQHRAATRRRIIREVEDAIQRTSASDGPETLQSELRDRLDTPDLNDDITFRPAADIITEICRDLGLAAAPGGAHPWKRRTPEDIARLRAAAASGTCQPGPEPQGPRPGAAPLTPGPQPGTAAHPRAQPGPTHRDPIHASPINPSPINSGSNPPEDAAGPMILRHPARVHGRCRPPHPA